MPSLEQTPGVWRQFVGNSESSGVLQRRPERSRDLAHIREVWEIRRKISVATALDLSLVRLLLILALDLVDYVHAFVQDLREGRESLGVEVGVVSEVDEHL